MVRKIRNMVEFEEALAIRLKVFVEEQKVPVNLEYEYENVCEHFLALLENQPVGTARYRSTKSGIKLERFAVLRDFRNNGVGSELVKALLYSLNGMKNIYLHAQVQVVDFYSEFGFVTFGNRFEEAGIEHFVMCFQPKTEMD